MRYSILGFNQAEVLKTNLDITDLMILQYIEQACGSPKMKHIVADDERALVWINHAKFHEDLPILNMSEGTFRNRLTKLRKDGFIESKTITNTNMQGSCTYYGITEQTINLLYSNDEIETTSRQNDMVDEPRHAEMTSDNKLIGNSKLEKISNNKLLDIDFFGYKEKKPKKQSLYEKCSDCINEYTNSPILNSLLHDYLTLRLQMKDKPLYGVNQWKGLLNKLSELCKEKNIPEDIVRYSIQRGYASFFMPNVSKSAVKSQPTENNVSCAKMTEEEKKAQAEFIEECKRKGLQYEF